MKTQITNETENTLISFHIGRGGRYNNAGHISYVDQDKSINDYVYDLFPKFENEQDFKNRFGYDYTGDKDQSCILELITDLNFEELEEKFGITQKMLGDQYYYTAGGSNTGLLVDNDGTGMIDEDGEYNTTIVGRLKDITEAEAELILKSSNWFSQDVKQFLLNKFENLQTEIEEEF
jgi:hypothetical protein